LTGGAGDIITLPVAVGTVIGLSLKHVRNVSADGVAAGLSTLCLLHCLLLPFAVATFPALLVGVGVEHGPWWVHWAMLVVAAPISIWALARGMRVHRDPAYWRIALIGFGLMAAGAVAHGHGPLEQALTVLGGIVVAFAHWHNWRARRAA
jgi:hypothetical protein